MPMRKYVPCERDREIVLHMAAIPGVTREQIAFCITNERAGKAINRRTLEKHFRPELEIGMAIMKKITMQSFVEQIRNHVWPATRLALNNYCGLKDGADIAVDASTTSNEMHIRFVRSPYADEPLEGPEPDGPPQSGSSHMVNKIPLEGPEEPPPLPQGGSLIRNSKYATVFDIPGTPWHKRPRSVGQR